MDQDVHMFTEYMPVAEAYGIVAGEKLMTLYVGIPAQYKRSEN